ncbi:hypothetical protein [Chromobacterium sp. CV08]
MKTSIIILIIILTPALVIFAQKAGYRKIAAAILIASYSIMAALALGIIQ